MESYTLVDGRDKHNIVSGKDIVNLKINNSEINFMCFTKQLILRIYPTIVMDNTILAQAKETKCLWLHINGHSLG